MDGKWTPLQQLGCGIVIIVFAWAIITTLLRGDK
jgi:hypothetical protein